MSDIPVLKRLLLVRDPRLPFLDLDLTDPDMGTPLAEVCLIGPNGSGKSTLLARLHEAITGQPRWMESEEGWFLAKYALGEGGDLYLAKPFGGGDGHVFRPEIEATEPWETLATDPPPFEELRTVFPEDLVLESAPGFASTGALWFDPDRCLVDGEAGDDLSSFLGSCLHERQEAFHRFLRAPENREKTVAEVEREFEASSPLALPLLKKAWNRLLAPSGLRAEFGCEDGSFFDPSGRPVAAERLGGALRNALLRTGLAATRGTAALFLDTPEEGLHPELVLDLIPLYRSLAEADPPRLFVATQSPLTASCFAPASRLRLVPGEDGVLRIVRGGAPEGTGIDDVLQSDFGIAKAPPLPKAEAAPAAESESETVVEPPSDPSDLKRAIQETDDEDELADLIDEVISIRRI